MANVDSQAFMPPPGWPFTIIPAGPAPTEPHKPSRRRLANNVVCMFAQDKEAVTNIRWRGRYPRVVTRLRFWDRLHPGDYCIFWPVLEWRGMSPNEGAVIRLIKPDESYPGWWLVKGVHRQLHTSWTDDPTNPDGYALSWETLAHETNLRRCPPPGGYPRREKS